MTAAATPPFERRHPPDALMRVINPGMRALLRSPAHRLVSGSLLLLRYTGRRSGRAIALPAGYHRLPNGELALLTSSRWRHNFRGGRDAEVLVAGTTLPVHGVLVDDVDAVVAEYERLIGELGWEVARRRLGIHGTVDRAPTRAELVDVIRRSGLAIVRLAPR